MASRSAYCSVMYRHGLVRLLEQRRHQPRRSRRPAPAARRSAPSLDWRGPALRQPLAQRRVPAGEVAHRRAAAGTRCGRATAGGLLSRSATPVAALSSATIIARDEAALSTGTLGVAREEPGEIGHVILTDRQCKWGLPRGKFLPAAGSVGSPP